MRLVDPSLAPWNSPRPHLRSRVRHLAVLTVLAMIVALVGCAPATEVLVVVGTDVPASLPLQITVRASRGRVASTAPAVQRWQRVSTMADGGIELPASFALVPGGGTPDESVFLEIEANAAGTILRRHVSFRFVPRETQVLRVFLTANCLAPATGCHAPDACTILRRCEEQGLTCGDQGSCVDVSTTLGTDRDGSFGDVGAVSNCGAYGQVCCYVGGACNGPLACVANRCQRCTDTGEVCCNGGALRPNGSACGATSVDGGVVPGSCSDAVCVADPDVAAPTNVMAQPTSSTEITVNWTAVPAGIATYTVQTSTDPGFATPTTVSGVTATDLLVNGLSAGRRYYARVQAVAADGRTSVWSTVASAITALPAPATPSITVTIPGTTRAVSACCWVYVGAGTTYYFAVAHASSSCPAGTSIQYHYQAQYTGTTTRYGWTGWMGPDAYAAAPLTPYGVEFFVQAQCVGPDVTSVASGTATACRLRSGGTC